MLKTIGYLGSLKSDNDFPLIVVNHASLKFMVNYFNDKLCDLDVEYLDEGYHISYFK